jgi:signal transduction histidine kinase
MPIKASALEQEMAMRNAFSWLRATRCGVSVAAALCTVLLSAWGVALVISQHSGRIGAPIAVLLMVTPVAFARRSPLIVAAMLAAGALVNNLLFGHLVRCGPALPAAFYVAYVVAATKTGRERRGGLTLVLAGVAMQCIWDPKLGASQIALMAPATLLFFGAGAVVRSRSLLVMALRERNAQLVQQRERTAKLTVAADQARIRSELVDGLRLQIHEIAQTASDARAGTAPATESLAAIEQTGRAALDRMRDIVGTIRSAPTEPEPDLDALEELLRSATTCDVRLSIEGDPRVLPASIELSSYRIVERLIASLDDDPAARAQVRVTFEVDALEILVTGPMSSGIDAVSSFGGVLDRAALHGGTVRLAEPGGRLDAHVRLPLVTSHA